VSEFTRFEPANLAWRIHFSRSYFMTEAQIYLPYFLQGSDLGFRLGEADSVGDALEAHAAALNSAADALRAVKARVEGKAVEFDAVSDEIHVVGPEAVIKDLMAEGLACKPDLEDVDNDDDCCNNCRSRARYERWLAMARQRSNKVSSGRRGGRNFRRAGIMR
jgi:hypothetical protein